jgi:hypothetical protein
VPCQIVVDGGGIATGQMVSPTIAGLIPGPTHESVFAMEAHGRALALILQLPDVGLPLICSAVSEKVPLDKGFV